MLCRAAETHTAAEHFSMPISEPGKNSFDGLYLLMANQTTPGFPGAASDVHAEDGEGASNGCG